MVGDSITDGSAKTLTEVLASQGFTDIDDRGRDQPADRSRRRQARADVGRRRRCSRMLADRRRPRRVGASRWAPTTSASTRTRRRVRRADRQMLDIDARATCRWCGSTRTAPTSSAGPKQFNEVLRERGRPSAATRGRARGTIRRRDAETKSCATTACTRTSTGTLVFADLVPKASPRSPDRQSSVSDAPAALAEAVADRAHGLDQVGVLLAELGAQAADVDVDRAGAAVVLVAPHPLTAASRG